MQAPDFCGSTTCLIGIDHGEQSGFDLCRFVRLCLWASHVALTMSNTIVADVKPSRRAVGLPASLATAALANLNSLVSWQKLYDSCTTDFRMTDLYYSIQCGKTADPTRIRSCLSSYYADVYYGPRSSVIDFIVLHTGKRTAECLQPVDLCALTACYSTKACSNRRLAQMH